MLLNFPHNPGAFESYNGMSSTAIQFTMHPDLLRSVIKRQAGTLSKAILEGVMNSIDAGSSHVDVTLMNDFVSIIDDGRGFSGREEIDLFFTTFGQPHEEGDAIYGKFRMGRGQMFAFGKNVWRTGSFQMNVDIDKNLGFDLQEGLPFKKGCDIKIDLYRPMQNWEYSSIEREIVTYVKYTNVPVFINGVQVNKPPTLKDFPDSINEAFIKLDATSSGIQVYNLGVYVQTIPSSSFGVGGVVISRNQMVVNFARNAVMVNECPVWAAAKPIINKRGRELVVKKPTLSDAERENAIDRIIQKDVNRDDLRSIKVFVDVTGKAWSINMINRGGFAYWSFAKKGDGQADLMIQNNTALVFDENWLAKFEVDDLSQVFDSNGYRSEYYGNFPKFKDFETLCESKQSEHTLIAPKDYTAKEKVWLALLNSVAYEYFKTVHGWNWSTSNKRDLRIGKSNSANAWTDGESEVIFNRTFLKDHPMVRADGAIDLAHVTRVLQTFIHEYTHDADSRENMHSPEFYQAYHDDSHKALGCMLALASGWVTKNYRKLMEAAKKKNGGVLEVDETIEGMAFGEALQGLDSDANLEAKAKAMFAGTTMFAE